MGATQQNQPPENWESSFLPSKAGIVTMTQSVIPWEHTKESFHEPQ